MASPARSGAGSSAKGLRRAHRRQTAAGNFQPLHQAHSRRPSLPGYGRLWPGAGGRAGAQGGLRNGATSRSPADDAPRGQPTCAWKYRTGVALYERLGAVAPQDRHQIWGEAELAEEPQLNRKAFPGLRVSGIPHGRCASRAGRTTSRRGKRAALANYVKAEKLPDRGAVG